MLETVRKRVQKKMRAKRHKYFKRSRKLLLKHFNKLNLENKDALTVMLSMSSNLAATYHLKELFFDFISSKNSNEAKPKLQKFILSAQASNLDEFKATLTMLANWGRYLLNAFDCPYSNKIILCNFLKV